MQNIFIEMEILNLKPKYVYGNGNSKTRNQNLFMDMEILE